MLTARFWRAFDAKYGMPLDLQKRPVWDKLLDLSEIERGTPVKLAPVFHHCLVLGRKRLWGLGFRFRSGRCSGHVGFP